MQTPNDLGDKALGTAQNVGVLDDRINVSWCGIQMAEQCGAQAKVAAGKRRAEAGSGRVVPRFKKAQNRSLHTCAQDV
jgi:hypothetical protein